MSREIFVKWLEEPRSITAAPAGIPRHLFLDNAAGQYETPESLNALQQINTIIERLPTNATEKVQPLDSFIISTFKRMWCDEWDKEKKRRIEEYDFSTASGKLRHPHRHWYMELAVRIIDEMNNLVDENGYLFQGKL